MVKVIFCFVLLLLTTVVNTAAQAKCNGGAECITLENCTGLYNTLTLPSSNNSVTNNTQLTKLLRSLHCGFDNNKPLICCPPEFRSEPVVISRDNFPVYYENTTPDPETIVPDGQICGIQSQDKMLAKHPWTALLRYEKTIGWGFFCGGVLISSKYVLTTASCVIRQDLPSTWNLSQVRLGEWDTSSLTDCYGNECSDPHLDVTIEKIITHDKYNPNDRNQYNDIALLRLAQKVQFTDYVKPICLPKFTDYVKSIGLAMAARIHTFEDYEAEVAGWGKVESEFNLNVKEISVLPIIGAPECSNVFGRNINQNQICAGGAKNPDTCVGDYGGALMGLASNDSNWQSLGLLSYRPISCGSPEFPSVYTRVDAYLDWIIQMMKP